VNDRFGPMGRDQIPHPLRVEQIDVGRYQRAGALAGAQLLLGGDVCVGTQIHRDDDASPVEQDLRASLAHLPECPGDQHGGDAHARDRPVTRPASLATLLRIQSET